MDCIYCTKIIKRFENEYLRIRNTYQYIEHLTDHKNRYLYESHAGFFNVMFWIYSDHLILSLMKLFDPAIMGKNENFSIKMIENRFDVSLINKQESTIKIEPDKKISINDVVEKLKEYRNKYLAHFDLKKDRLDFPPTHELLKEAKILLGACHEAYQKLEGKEISQDITLKDEHTIIGPLRSEVTLIEITKELGKKMKNSEADEREKRVYFDLFTKIQTMRQDKGPDKKDVPS